GSATRGPRAGPLAGVAAPVHAGACTELRLVAVAVAGESRPRSAERRRRIRDRDRAGLRVLDRLERDHAGLGDGGGWRPRERTRTDGARARQLARSGLRARDDLFPGPDLGDAARERPARLSPASATHT